MQTTPGWGALAIRAGVIGATATGSLTASAVVALCVSAGRGRRAGRRSFAGGIAHLLQRLGPTFVKAGQIMATRRDVLPGDVCDALAVLHDAVTPMTASAIRRALVEAYGSVEAAPFDTTAMTHLASGSVASVFRTTLCGGRVVAVKLRRPGLARVMTADLSLLEAMARAAERLPKCQGMPIGDLMAHVSTAILGQLDLAREALHLSRLRASLSHIDGLSIPAVVAEASRPGCLVMEYIPDLSGRHLAAHGAADRRRFALTILQAVHEMIFVAGFVHCDLHPGNLYVTPGGQVVVLDAGYSVQLSPRVRMLIAEFFAALSRGDGRRCAEIIIESAARPKAGTDVAGFVAAMQPLVAAHAGPDAGPFAMMTFGDALFDLQREFGLYAESDFAFPMMALAVIDSSVRAISSAVDLQELGRLAELQMTIAASRAASYTDRRQEARQ
jgi:ubiquinone biosynthesis protein